MSDNANKGAHRFRREENLDSKIKDFTVGCSVVSVVMIGGCSVLAMLFSGEGEEKVQKQKSIGMLKDQIVR